MHDGGGNVADAGSHRNFFHSRQIVAGKVVHYGDDRLEQVYRYVFVFGEIEQTQPAAPGGQIELSPIPFPDQDVVE
jgi:hypothetical protein